MWNGSKRFAIVALLLIALAGAEARANRARADGGLSLLLGLAALGATVVVVGIVTGSVRLVQAIAKESAPPAAPPPSARTPAAPDAAASEGGTADMARRAFLARPHCDSVGGYEAYMKATGNYCRLH